MKNTSGMILTGKELKDRFEKCKKNNLDFITLKPLGKNPVTEVHGILGEVLINPS